jgi:hypothetical protein
MEVPMLSLLARSAAVVALAIPLVGAGTPNLRAQETFNGYPCTVDCSGHEAGYEWAERNGITDASDCGGNSQSFIEGCESYAEDYGSPDEDEYIDGEESEESEYE